MALFKDFRDKRNTGSTARPAPDPWERIANDSHHSPSPDDVKAYGNGPAGGYAGPKPSAAEPSSAFPMQGSGKEPPSGPESRREDTRPVKEPAIPSFQFTSTSTSKQGYFRRDAGPATEKLWEVFTPSRPQTSDQMFVGRRAVIEKIVCAIEQEHAHVVVYGGRGIGKTSVGNIIAASARRAGYHVARFTCDSETSFERLMRDFLRSLPVDFTDRSSRAMGLPNESFDQFRDLESVGPTDLSNAFGSLIDRVILIVDEFDRVNNKDFYRKMSEAIKIISDSTDLVSIVIMGIGKTLDDLLGQHLSIQRQIKAIRLPLLDNAELEVLLNQGKVRAGIDFDDVVRDSIVTLSRGSPYYAHLLGLLSGRHAMARKSNIINQDDVRAAISDILAEFDPNVINAYERTTQTDTNTFMADIVFGAAVAPFDAYGRFTAEGALKALESYTGRSYEILNISRGLARLNRDGPHKILEKLGSPGATATYDFINPLMRQYVLLRQVNQRGFNQFDNNSV
jgi:hypothetical protein